MAVQVYKVGNQKTHLKRHHINCLPNGTLKCTNVYLALSKKNNPSGQMILLLANDIIFAVSR